MMDLEQLRIFYDLVFTESFRKLSASNKLSVAKISRELSALETELGYRLIERKPGYSNMSLTRQGKVLFEALPQVFGIFDNLKQVMNTDPELNSGNITIHTTNSLIENWIVFMIPKLQETYPNIQLNLIANNNLLTRDLKENVISISPASDEKNKNFFQVPLLNFHVGLWASKKYLDQYGRPTSLSDLQKHKVMLFTKELDQMTYPNLNWYLKDSNVMIPNQMCINSTLGLLKAAHHGLGIISLSEENIRVAGYQLERVLPEINGPTVPMCLTYPTYWKDNSIIENLATFFKTQFCELNKTPPIFEIL
ncbi:MAG: LysR family transcriptional regulator [Holosporales bacterium]|nr:LysR family transcriptional regulator [Holosporales bacterium]